MELYNTPVILTEESKLAIAFIAGIACIIIGNYKRSQYRKLKASGVKVEGTVVDILEEDRTSADDFVGKSVIYYPVISYKTLEGEVLIRKHDIGSNPCAYNIDDTVDVIYDTTDNRVFITDDKLTKLIGPVIMIFGGVIIAVVLIWYFFHTRHFVYNQ